LNFRRTHDKRRGELPATHRATPWTGSAAPSRPAGGREERELENFFNDRWKNVAADVDQNIFFRCLLHPWDVLPVDVRRIRAAIRSGNFYFSPAGP
jgi:hypothetical protein